MKKKLLYVEDMRESFDNTRRALEEEYNIDWRKNTLDAIKAIEGDISQYGAAIFDVNLYYNPSRLNNKQTKEGLGLIYMLKREIEEKGIKLPIICVSRDNNEKEALKNGADVFMFKKEFWSGKGKQILKDLL